MTERAVMLFSSLSTDQIVVVNTRRLEDVLKGKKLSHDKVDGVLPENKEVRDKLFSVSGQRGKYPQCFIVDGEGNYRFVGIWDEVESLVDCDALPSEVLAANPTIPTFSSVRISLFLKYSSLLDLTPPRLMRNDVGICKCGEKWITSTSFTF